MVNAIGARAHDRLIMDTLAQRCAGVSALVVEELPNHCLGAEHGRCLR